MKNMISELLQHPLFEYDDRTAENITTTFFKCTRWQFEETTDPLLCPFHYYCTSIYPGNYPPLVDFSLLFFTAASFLLTLAFTLTADTKPISTRRRYWLPSGPFALPIILLALAKGHRINTAFSLSSVGPALLQLVLISALAFENAGERSIKYVVFEVSVVSGILHASLYLDSVILPYYTGLEALLFSQFSGECGSCICRREALVAGGSLISYRGWSMTMLSVVATLCLRIVCALVGEDRGSVLLKIFLEGIAWICIATDAIYLMMNSPRVGCVERAAYGGVCLLILLHLLKKAAALLASHCQTTSSCKESRMELKQLNWVFA
ncbi:hypothetical protein ACLOJK_004655 [Asimina triloba]